MKPIFTGNRISHIFKFPSDIKVYHFHISVRKEAV